MIDQKQLDAWRKTEMEKTTMPLVDELAEARAWDVVGELIEEVERLEGARALFHSGGAVHHCPLCYAPTASTNIDAERDAIRAAIESKARAESAEKALEALREWALTARRLWGGGGGVHWKSFYAILDAWKPKP